MLRRGIVIAIVAFVAVAAARQLTGDRPQSLRDDLPSWRAPKLDEDVQHLLAGLSLQEKIGQMLQSALIASTLVRISVSIRSRYSNVPRESWQNAGNRPCAPGEFPQCVLVPLLNRLLQFQAAFVDRYFVGSVLNSPSVRANAAITSHRPVWLAVGPAARNPESEFAAVATDHSRRAASVPFARLQSADDLRSGYCSWRQLHLQVRQKKERKKTKAEP